MVRCPACGIFTPPYAFENGTCLDDLGPEFQRGWGRSPSALAIQRLRARRADLIGLPLEPESTEELRREIRLDCKSQKGGKSAKTKGETPQAAAGAADGNNVIETTGLSADKG